MAYSALYHTLFSKNKVGGQKRSLNDVIKLFNQKKDFLLNETFKYPHESCP